MNTHKKYFGVRTIALLVLIAALIFGGFGITGAAAQSSIPGDALYPVKTTFEQARLALAKDAGDRSVIKISLAEQRLQEIKLLISEGRYGEVNQAVLAFETNINGAILEVETVAKADPTRAASLAVDIISALTRYAQVLTELAASAPDNIKGEVTRALDTTHVASGLQMPSADDNSNENVNDNNSNSNDNADDDNGNDNANDNANDNGNDNADDDSDDNADDDNGNDNADDDSNDNAADDSNDNAADDSNDNGDDDSNDNGDDDSNDNADDDNGDDGSNDNGDDGSNDNANDSDDNSDDDNGGSEDGDKDD